MSIPNDASSKPEAPPNPSVNTQWKKGQSGNPSGKKKGEPAKSLKAIVTKKASAPVAVTTPDGHKKKLSHGEALLLSVFYKAANDAAAMKLVVSSAKTCLPPAPEQAPPQENSGGVWAAFELSQEDVDGWKAADCLPAGCPDKIEDIDERTLSRAHRIWLRRNRVSAAQLP